MMSETPPISKDKHALLEKYLRGDLPQAARTEGSTDQVDKAALDDRPERVVAIQAIGSKQPFFYLHGDWTHHAFYCFNLAHDLGPDQPFYALETYSFDGLSIPPKLEAIAAAHITSMRTVQPNGPYLLGGWCNGALVAYEMARQLHAAEQEVKLLVLLDPEPPAARVRLKLTRGIIALIGFLKGLNRARQLDWFLWTQHLYKYLRYPQWRSQLNQRLKNGTQAAQERKSGKSSFALPRLDAMFPATQIIREYYPGMFRWRLVDYSPHLYPGKVTIIWNSEGDFRNFDRAQWFKLLKGQEMEVYVIPDTTHETMKSASLPALAECLRMCISKVQAAGPS